MKSRTAYMVNYIKHAPTTPKTKMEAAKQNYIMQSYSQELMKHPDAAAVVVKQVNAAVDQREHPWKKQKKAAHVQELGDSKELQPPQVASGKTVTGMNKAGNASVQSQQQRKEAELKKAMDKAAAAGDYIKAGKLQAQLAADKKAIHKQQAPQKAAPKQQAPQKAAPKQQAPQKAAPKRQAPQKAAAKQQAPQKAATKQQAPQKAATPQAQQPPVQSDVSIQAQRPPASQVAAAMAEFGPGGTYCKDCS